MKLRSLAVGNFNKGVVKSKTAAITAALFCFDMQAIKVSLIGWLRVHGSTMISQRSQKF